MMIFHVFPRDRTFVSGRDKKGYLKHGTVQDGIERDNVDGIEISRDCTGRDWDTTGLHGTRLIYYRIARDGMKKRFDTVFVRYTASTSVSYDTIAFLVLLSYANVIGAMAWTNCIRSLSGELKNIIYCVQRSSSGVFTLRAVALTTAVVLLILPLPSTTHTWWTTNAKTRIVLYVFGCTYPPKEN